MKKKMLALATVVGSVTAFVGSASASTVSFDFTVPLTTTEINETRSLGLFDSNLGTLTGATFELSGNLSTVITLTNASGAAQNITGTTLTALSVTTTIAALSALWANPVFNLSATTGAQALASGASVTVGPLTDVDTTSYNLIAILASLTAPGGGFFNVACTTSSGLLLTGSGGNASGTQATQAGCGAKITYEYNEISEVPVPAALPLMASALGILGFAGWRRKFSTQNVA